MATKTLTRKALSRATLARQLLLQRDKGTPLRAVEQLFALQAQLPRPPFVSLWSRLEGFRREKLVRLLTTKKLVRATTMRGTLHLMAARDLVAMRTALQAQLTRGMQTILRKRADAIDVDAVVAEAREFFDAEPRTFDELRAHLEKRHKGGDIRALAYAVRMHLPLIQVPADAPWGYPTSADFAVAESWLGKELSERSNERDVVRRYLRSFGPASVADAQSWTGMTGLRDVFEALRPKLATFRDESGRELFDLPDAPRPAANLAAPARFLPDFDSLILAYDDRSRLMADEHRPKVCLKNLRVLPTFLVDGMVHGTWKIERKKRTAELVASPFEPLAKKHERALTVEGEALLRFVEEDAETFSIRIARPK